MIKKLVLSLFVVLGLSTWLTLPVLAETPHEDPENAPTVYSGAALLLYYSGSLDEVLQKDIPAAETALGKMPFANIPPDLDSPSAVFAGSGIALTQSLSDLFSIWDQENNLVLQFRLDEAAALGDRIAAGLPQARQELAALHRSVADTGSYLNVSALPETHVQKQAYAAILEKLDRLEAMLDLLSRPLFDSAGLQAVLNNAGVSLSDSALAEVFKGAAASLSPAALAEILKPSDLTLDAVSPRVAFVGDEVAFRGRLTSQGRPLASREVTLLLDQTPYFSVATDSLGYYEGRFQVPAWYQPSLSVRTVFFPSGADVGVYLGAASPVVNLTVQYYESALSLQLSGPAYPGQSAALIGSFDYGPSPAPPSRTAQLYLDDVPIAQFSSSLSFQQSVAFPAQFLPGWHSLMVSVPPDGRYAPVQSACPVEVVLAPLSLDLSWPGVVFLPGSFTLGGRLSSALGPAQGAAVSLEAFDSRFETLSTSDGSFQTPVKAGMALSLLGSQSVALRVQPAEPWNAPLEVPRSLFVVNYLNCALLFLLLSVLAWYLPRRLKKWYGFPSRKMPVPVEPPPVAVTASAPARLPDTHRAEDSPGEGLLSLILKLFQQVLKLVQNLSHQVLKPQQTLREYFRESGPSLGPVTRSFAEFTLLVERLLYSSHPPADSDLAKGRRLSRSIQEEAKHEDL